MVGADRNSRTSGIDSSGVCNIGIKRAVLVPFTVYELTLNVWMPNTCVRLWSVTDNHVQVYLTVLFLAPLKSKQALLGRIDSMLTLSRRRAILWQYLFRQPSGPQGGHKDLGRLMLDSGCNMRQSQCIGGIERRAGLGLPNAMQL